MTNILTSIIVCAFNEEKMLSNCLDSIKSSINSQADTTEIIIIDNNSSDCTSNIALNFISNNNNNLIVKYLKIEHVPLTSSRNTGISVSRGTYIIFVDADAIVGKDWLINILSEFNENTLIVAGNVGNINTKSYFADFIYNAHYKCSLRKDKYIGANMAFNRSVFELNHGFLGATGNRGDETLFFQEYLSRNPHQVIGFAKESFVYNDFPTSFFVWLNQQYIGGREYLKISKFNRKSAITISQEILRIANILFIPHLVVHFFYALSPFYIFHFILFLLRNIYKIEHCYCGFKNLFIERNFIQAFLFLPVTFFGVFLTDLGFMVQFILSFNKKIDKSDAKVSLVLSQVKSNKLNKM